MTTPRALHLFVTVITLLTIGLGTYLTFTSNAIAADLQSTHRNNGPANAAADAVAGLTMMDLQLANVLREHGPDPAKSGTDAKSAYEAARRTAAKGIERAGGSAALVEAFGGYEQLAGRMQSLLEKTPAGKKPTSEVLSAFRAANAHHRTKLMPEAERWQDNRATTLPSGSPAGAVPLALLLGVLLITGLISLQWFISRRTHRMFNPALLLATLVVTVLTGIAAGTFFQAETDQVAAGGDDAAAAAKLADARKVSLGARADQIRYLADPGYASPHEEDFYGKSYKILDPSGGGPENYAKDLPANAGDAQHFDGLLGDAFEIILDDTHPSSAEATQADDVMRGYIAFHLEDQRMRKYTKAGDAASAQRILTGDEFKRYDDELARMTVMMRDSADKPAREALHGWPTIPDLTLVFALGLVFLGVWPRLAEYR